jgi:UDP-N-acetyl-D-glucosamine dehydrogenase
LFFFALIESKNDLREVSMELMKKIEHKRALIGVIGMGYVGLPLVLRLTEVGFRVIGFDTDDYKVTMLNQGQSYIRHIPSPQLAKLRQNRNGGQQFEATSNMGRLNEPDVLIICVPTPLNANREPDLRYVENTTRLIADTLRPGQLISLESTTYPGTTDELLLPLLSSRLEVGIDYYLVYSPEREDPGNPKFEVRTIPKVVGGVTPACLEHGVAIYSKIVEKVVSVSCTRAAEMSKLLENIYRAVNIALINELKILCLRMGLDIFEIIEASRTKPFGFQPFYPGPGLGGHCIPIDPFYLTWKARSYDFATRFIELAGEINTNMPYFVVERVIEALNERGRPLKGSRILILGLAYKRDVDDARETPAFKIIELLNARGAQVDYNDPYIPVAPETRHYRFNQPSIELTAENLASYDCVVVTTDHSTYEPDFIVEHAQLVVDTRNLIKTRSDKVKKA